MSHLRPLKAYRVLDLTNVLAGPFCCHQLAHMGADVVKVEMPGEGDLARQLGADSELSERNMGISFLAQNPGKRSITLNLKSEEGRTLLKRLVSSADVLVENFRPGVMDRLGVGFDALGECNTRLVYCAISGFGQDGPLHRLPAYDQIIQGMAGVMSITGGADSAPYRVGYPIADTTGGMTAAFAVASVLADTSREGPVLIDVSMLESVLATMGWVVSNYLLGGVEPRPLGNENASSAPSGTFQAADGLLNIAANKQEQFEAVCRVVDRPELIHEIKFRDREERKKNRDTLRAEIESELQHETVAHWVSRLNDAGVPAGPVLTVAEALAHDQVRGRGVLGQFQDVPGVGRDIELLRTGFKLNGLTPQVDCPPPPLGAHNGEIYAELGLDENELAILKARGVI